MTSDNETIGFQNMNNNYEIIAKKTLGDIGSLLFRLAIGSLSMWGVWSLIIISFWTVPALPFFACLAVAGLVEYVRLIKGRVNNA